MRSLRSRECLEGRGRLDGKILKMGLPGTHLNDLKGRLIGAKLLRTHAPGKRGGGVGHVQFIGRYDICATVDLNLKGLCKGACRGRGCHEWSLAMDERRRLVSEVRKL